MSHIVILSGVTARHWGTPVRVVTIYEDAGVRMAECYPADADGDGDADPMTVPVAQLVFA